jgi:signal transduction histidine kinase
VRSSSRFLVVLLALTLGLSGLLAFEAQRATRSHQVTADRALRDYATVAAWEFVSASEEQLDRSLAAALGPVTGTPAVSPYDSLPPAAALAPSADSVLRCDGFGNPGRYFVLDFRTGSLSTSRATRDRPAPPWLRDSLLVGSRRSLSRGTGYGILWPSRGPANEIALYGIKSLRYSGYAVHDAPLAAYGFVTCATALNSLFADVLARHPLLPRSVTGGVTNAELATIDVADPGGHEIYRAGPPAGDGAFEGMASSGSLVVRVRLPAAVAGRLVVARPASRLPVLLGLLALTAGLAIVAARQLRREQDLVRLRADFTSSVSHELRTPLTQILLFAETLELGRAGDEDARREAVDIIVQEARRLAHLVENVLHFSRAERQMVRVRKEVLSMAPLVREITERFVPLAGNAALRIRTELDERLVAPVDAECLHQILINLLDNAVKYGGGTVVVRTSLHEGHARIEVEDAGPGIPAGDEERIWKPFVRLRRSDGVPGSGIGLAVVRQLAVAHQGRSSVEDVPGGGTRFIVELPGATSVDLTAPGSGGRVMEASWPEC